MFLGEENSQIRALLFPYTHTHQSIKHKTDKAKMTLLFPLFFEN